MNGLRTLEQGARSKEQIKDPNRFGFSEADFWPVPCFNKGG